MSGAAKTSVSLRGAMTALVTPFDERGGVDRRALARVVAWQVESGIHALVPCGTTGEGATLSEDEKYEVVSVAVEAAQGRVPVIAGCGTNDTRTTLAGARQAARAGASALLVVTPYYNKPNATGMVAHFEAVAGEAGLPVVVYNVPGRTGQNLGAELTLRLARIDGVAGVKEASGNLEQIGAILAGRPPGFAVLSGDDALALPTLALGAEGLVSVVSNPAPRETAELVDAAQSGALGRARELHYRLLPLMRACFLESNPVPVKTAMHLLGFCAPDVRAPLGPPARETVEALRHALASAEVSRVAS